eukprot:gene12698-13653_t
MADAAPDAAAAVVRRAMRGEGMWPDGTKVGRVHPGVRLQPVYRGVLRWILPESPSPRCGAPPRADHIFAGRKTVEGRLASGWARAAQPGDVVCFAARHRPLTATARRTRRSGRAALRCGGAPDRGGAPPPPLLHKDAGGAASIGLP